MSFLFAFKVRRRPNKSGYSGLMPYCVEAEIHDQPLFEQSPS